MSAVEKIVEAVPLKHLQSLKNKEAIIRRYRGYHIKQAQSLPSKLQRFFAVNPPRQLLPSIGRLSLSSKDEALAMVSDTGDINFKEPAAAPAKEAPNPFQPHKNPKTGNWRPSRYSMRQQADLVKLAEKHGVEELLPFTPKLSSERLRKRVEQGIRMKGTGVGQRVKGHLWERQLKGKLEKRRQAMLAMPQMIQTWRQRGKGKGWKKWPSK